MSSITFGRVELSRIGSGRPVVLLHGLGATRSMWVGLAGLGSQFELISYDLPGHGVGETAFEIDDLSDQLAAVMTEAGIARASIVGSSVGGMIALHFTVAHPERVSRLVLCDTTPALSEGARDALLIMPDRGPIHAAMARADLMDLAEEIYAPTLVLCAEGADLGMREGADFLARSIPGGQLAFAPGAVADSVTERPDWVTRVLLDFLG